MTGINILLITADDMDGLTPGAFGGHPDVTPGLDRLAQQGAVFRRSHVAVAVCQPSRSSIMTGLWPHRNGAEGFEPIDDGVPVITSTLKQAGYLVGILGKVAHLQPVERYGWDMNVDEQDLGMGRNPGKYADAMRSFLHRASEAAQPWFMMVNSHDPHRPFAGSRQELSVHSAAEREGYPAPSRTFGEADRLDVPGFLPDTDGVREEYAEYLGSSRRCDDTVSAVLQVLEDAGQADDTLVVFLSDNGMAFPFAKANCYLRSTLTPLIVRWPGHVRPGLVVQDEFVSMLDLFPTFCEAAGVTHEGELDGRSILPLLRDGHDEFPRARVFSVFHETSAKQRLEMRCIQDAEYGYIWNAWSDGEVQYRAENMQGLSWPSMLEAAEGTGEIAQRVDFYLHRTPEELYDLRADPDCLVNLADHPEHLAALRSRRNQMIEWMTEIGDALTERFAALIDS
ncbi:sulfatase [Okibacterium endophyticum]